MEDEGKTSRTAVPNANPASSSATAHRARAAADDASAHATATEANAAKLRMLAGAGNKDPDVPMTEAERAGGLGGSAAYNKRKQKYLAEWRAKSQADALK